MTQEQLDACPEAQRRAFVALQERSGIPWEEFLANARAPLAYDPYIAIPNFHGMFVGVEQDGYTHS